MIARNMWRLDRLVRLALYPRRKRLYYRYLCWRMDRITGRGKTKTEE